MGSPAAVSCGDEVIGIRGKGRAGESGVGSSLFSLDLTDTEKTYSDSI